MKKSDYLEQNALQDSAELKVKISDIYDTRVQFYILRVVAFWYPKAKTMRQGHRWLIRSASEFQEDDAIPYKKDTLWKTVRQLRKDGWLITERHFHPYEPTRGPVNWIRPTVTLVDDVGKVAKKMMMAQKKEEKPPASGLAQYGLGDLEA